MSWQNTYKYEKQILQDHNPGKKLEEVLGEIQNKCITDIVVDGDIEASVNIENNTATITLEAPEAEAQESALPPWDDAKIYQVLQIGDGGKPVWDYVRAH